MGTKTYNLDYNVIEWNLLGPFCVWNIQMNLGGWRLPCGSLHEATRYLSRRFRKPIMGGLVANLRIN